MLACTVTPFTPASHLSSPAPKHTDFLKRRWPCACLLLRYFCLLPVACCNTSLFRVNDGISWAKQGNECLIGILYVESCSEILRFARTLKCRLDTWMLLEYWVSCSYKLGLVKPVLFIWRRKIQMSSYWNFYPSLVTGAMHQKQIKLKTKTVSPHVNLHLSPSAHNTYALIWTIMLCFT